MKKKDKNITKKFLASAAVYIVSIAVTIYMFTIDDGNRNWLEFMTWIVIPPLTLLYVLYLFRPRTDVLATVLYAVFGIIGTALVSYAVAYALLILSLGIN